jgi:nucleotide-binding universal stress UspA family protein
MRAALPRAGIGGVVLDGPVADMLVAESESADLLVVGYHRDHPVRSIIAGAMPERLAARVRCPTIVVPHDWEPHGGDVVLGLSDDRAAEAAAEFAARECDRDHCGMVVVYAWSARNRARDGTAEDVVRTQHRELLNDRVRALRRRHPDLSVRAELADAPIPRALVAAADPARLIVLGTRHRGPLSRLMLGSVLLDLLPHARCAIGIVPAPPREQPATRHRGDETPSERPS